jgi:hypothetical protein
VLLGKEEVVITMKSASDVPSYICLKNKEPSDAESGMAIKAKKYYHHSSHGFGIRDLRGPTGIWYHFTLGQIMN